MSTNYANEFTNKYQKLAYIFPKNWKTFSAFSQK